MRYDYHHFNADPVARHADPVAGGPEPARQQDPSADGEPPPHHPDQRYISTCA